MTGTEVGTLHCVTVISIIEGDCSPKTVAMSGIIPVRQRGWDLDRYLIESRIPGGEGSTVDGRGYIPHRGGYRIDGVVGRARGHLGAYRRGWAQ